MKNAHPIEIVHGSLLERTFEHDHASTNSSHHQAVDPATLPAGLRITAQAPDGIVEAFEVIEDGPFDNGAWFLALQWHPERLTDRPDQLKLFQAFIKAARTGR